MLESRAIARFEGCAPWDPVLGNQYGYKPSLAAGIAFCVLFTVTMTVHVAQAWYKKRWWCLLFAIGALTELLGWAGRTWSAECPSNLNAFLMQITTLIIAPTFFTAAIYVILGRLIVIMGKETSPISATTYLWIFCGCDLISLVVQAVGGSMASQAAAATPPRKSETGTNIMVGGIVFQMASITVFVFLFLEFLRRTRKQRRSITAKIYLLVGASAFSCLMIYIRSIYRTVELLQGWSGYLITHEGYFIGLDAVLMFLAVVVFNFIHPGWFLPTLAEQHKRDSVEGGVLEMESEESKKEDSPA